MVGLCPSWSSYNLFLSFSDQKKWQNILPGEGNNFFAYFSCSILFHSTCEDFTLKLKSDIPNTSGNIMTGHTTQKKKSQIYVLDKVKVSVLFLSFST